MAVRENTTRAGEIEIADSATGAAQEVSEKISAGTFFFWWPAKEGRLVKATAYAADSRNLGIYTPPTFSALPPSPHTSATHTK